MVTSAQSLRVGIRFTTGPQELLNLRYTPLNNGHPMDDLHAAFMTQQRDRVDDETEKHLLTQARTLASLLASEAPTRSIRIDGKDYSSGATLLRVDAVSEDDVVTLEWVHPGAVAEGPVPLPLKALTEAQQALLENLLNNVRALCWADLRKRVGAPMPSTKPQVLISYRDRPASSRFAEAVARYLGAQGILPWWDKWEIRAGDSIPGRIAEGLKTSIAALLVVTSDYEQGKWATEEMNSAITKCVEDGFPVVCLRLDAAPLPELLRHRRYIDFSDRDPKEFESRMRDVLDGVLQIPSNPFR